MVEEKKVKKNFKFIQSLQTGFIVLLQPLYSFRLLIQAILDFCFFYIFKNLNRSEETRSDLIRDILVVKPDGIGDTILVFPFLRELKKTFPEAKVTLVVRSQVVNLLENCPFVDEVLPYTNDRHWGFHFFRGLRRAFAFSKKYFKDRHFDLAIYPRWGTDYYYGSLLVYLSGAQRRIGYSDRVTKEKHRINFGYDLLFTEAFQGGEGKHEVERNLEIIRHLGGNPDGKKVEYWFAPKDIDQARKKLEESGADNKSQLIALGIGAKQARRKWPVEDYADLARWLQDAFDAEILILGGPEDKAVGDVVKALAEKRVFNLAGKVSLRQASAVLSQCQFFIGNDSGPKHLASLCGCPTIEISCHPQESDPEESNSPLRFSAWATYSQTLRPRRQGPFCKRKCVAYFPHCICGIGVGEVQKAVLDLARAKGISFQEGLEEAKTPIPNFFIAGAPRSGTTSLSTYLRSHPNIFLSALKEPSYFDFDLYQKTKISLENYLALFKQVDPEVNVAIGEATPTYMFSDCAIAEIVKFNPKAKFIAVLRNPIDLAQSIHSHEVFWGEENIRDFEKAWRAEPDRREGKNIPFSCREPKWLWYSQWGRYGDQIGRLFGLAGKEQVKVVIFEDFVADPKKIYEEILGFLGVPSDGRTEFPKVNEGRTTRWLFLQQVYSLLVTFAWILRSKFGLGMKSYGISTKILSMNADNLKKNVISQSFREEMNRYYYDDVIKLSKLLGRDMTYWVTPQSPASKS